MPEWRGTTIQIIIALIGASSVFAAGIGSYLSELNKPDVKVDLSGNDDESIIKLTNLGKKPAMNLVLTVETDEKIVTGTIFNTENISRPDLDSKPLQVHIPRLVQGDGSIIRLNLKNVTKDEIDNVYATYDQGSTFYKEYGIGDQFFDALVTFLSYVGWFILFVIGGGFSVFFIILLFKTRKRKKEERKHRIYLVEKLLTSMIQIRDILSQNPSTREKIYKGVKLWDEKEVELWDKKEDILLIELQMINNIQDFILISDLYEELNKRKLYVQNLPKDKQNNKDIEEGLKEYNQRCLSAVEKALKGIDWSKYYVI